MPDKNDLLVLRGKTQPKTFEEFTKLVARLRMDDEMTEEELWEDASTSDILNELIATARTITGN